MDKGMVASYYGSCLDGLSKLVTEKHRQLNECRAALDLISKISKRVTEGEDLLLEALEALIVIKGEANRLLSKFKGEVIVMTMPKITEMQRAELTGLNEVQTAKVTAEVTRAFDVLTCVRPPKFAAGIDVQEVVVYVATRIKEMGRGG